MREQRRSQRFRHELLVELHDKLSTKKVYAVDVARHGLFLATPEPPRERHLVQLTVHLPGGAIRAAASVTRSLRGRTDHVDGVGVQFFALSDDAKQRWDDFIFALQRTTPPRGTPQPEAAPAAQPPAERSPDGAGATFLVKLKSVDRLREFQQMHLSAGGTVLFTPVLRAEGEHVTLIVVHPVTDEEFRLPGAVFKAHADRPKRLEIHFLGAGPQLASEFTTFVETGAPPRVQRTTPPSPVMEEKELDLDVQVWDEVWDDVHLDVDDEDVARAIGDVTAPPASSAELREPPRTPPLVAPLPAGRAKDPELTPTLFTVACDRCSAAPYPVELGPCRGLLGLVADLDAYVDPVSGRMVSVPRLISPEERAERRERWDGSGLMDVSLLFDAVALMDPPQDEEGRAYKRSRALERLDAAARKLAPDDAPAKSKVSCPHCKDGHLTLARG